MSISPLVSALGTTFALGVFVANIAIALGVYRDAQAMQLSARRRLRMFSPGTWALICLFAGIPALAVYWAAHYSTFAKD